MQRLSEILVAVLIIIVAALPMAMTGLLVWLSIGRPLLFSQTRVGLLMRPFTIEKFRTMHDRVDNIFLPDHLRETKVTRLIRRLRLDELPQLFAIIRGEMTFVGPRPLLQHTVDAMGELGRVRSLVRPGITGWAQVNGNTLLSQEEKLALDIWYVDHHSKMINCSILLKTLFTIIVGERIVPSNVAEALAHLVARSKATQQSQALEI